MRTRRQSGMLLHVTSLPSRGYAGTLGKAAYEFVDFLHASGMTIWQMLPVGPTGYGESPYQSISTYAGEPLLIDLDMLCDEGLLDERPADAPDASRVDFARAHEEHNRLLERAFEMSFDGLREQVEAFARRNFWARDYALFAAIRESRDEQMWNRWPDEALKRRETAALDAARARFADRINYHLFVQTLFERQWSALKKYANGRGVALFGDMPIYVAEDSADTWSQPEQFLLDADGRPIDVAGVPPDYFSADGQKWGNPLYNWARMKREGYAWWVRRMTSARERFDLVRVDHFIGFANYYAIPANSPTARVGKWIVGPGKALFKVLRREVKGLQIVAEDLGVVSPRVKRLLRWCRYPGMKVLLFAFGSDLKNPHLPRYHKKNALVYTGTHDNDTVCGWWARADEKERATALRVLGPEAASDISDAMIRAAYASRSRIAIVPLQDFLRLDNAARMNIPGTVGGQCWQWKCGRGRMDDALARRIAELGESYGRRGEAT